MSLAEAVNQCDEILDGLSRPSTPVVGKAYVGTVDLTPPGQDVPRLRWAEGRPKFSAGEVIAGVQGESGGLRSDVFDEVEIRRAANAPRKSAADVVESAGCASAGMPDRATVDAACRGACGRSLADFWPEPRASIRIDSINSTLETLKDIGPVPAYLAWQCATDEASGQLVRPLIQEWAKLEAVRESLRARVSVIRKFVASSGVRDDAGADAAAAELSPTNGGGSPVSLVMCATGAERLSELQNTANA